MDTFVEILKFFDLTPFDFWMIIASVALFVLYSNLSAKHLFKPLMVLAEERERRTSGAKEHASDLIAEASRLNALAEEAISAAKSQSLASRISKVAAATKEAANIVGHAETEARGKLKSAREELQQLEQRMRQDLKQQVEPIAKELAKKIINGGVNRVAGSSAGLNSFFIPALISSLGLILVLANNAYAAGPGHVPSFADTLKYWPHFITFVVVFSLILRKPFVSFWQNRVKKIEEDLDYGLKVRQEAELALEAAKAKYNNVPQEVSELQARIAKETEAECIRLVAEAKNRASSVVKRGEDSAIAEKSQLELKLREELAAQVLNRTEEILKSEVDSNCDSQLRQVAIEGAFPFVN